MNNIYIYEYTYDTETTYEHSCYEMTSEITLKDELSTVNIECIGIESCRWSIFIIDTPSLNKNADNNMLSNINIPRINMVCIGEDSCHYGVLTIIGLNNFALNCSGVCACDDFGLTLLSLDYMDKNDQSLLTVHCNGDESCDDIMIDATTLNGVTVNCLDGIFPCENMQVLGFISIYCFSIYIHLYFFRLTVPYIHLD